MGADYLVIAADLISLRHLKTIELTIWLRGRPQGRAPSVLVSLRLVYFAVFRGCSAGLPWGDGKILARPGYLRSKIAKEHDRTPVKDA